MWYNISEKRRQEMSYPVRINEASNLFPAKAQIMTRSFSLNTIQKNKGPSNYQTKYHQCFSSYPLEAITYTNEAKLVDLESSKGLLVDVLI